MKRPRLSPTDRADFYRACGAALRLVSKLPIEDLGLKSRIISHIYEAGNVQWVELCKLSCTEFAHAFDASRAKA